MARSAESKGLVIIIVRSDRGARVVEKEIRVFRDSDWIESPGRLVKIEKPSKVVGRTRVRKIKRALGNVIAPHLIRRTHFIVYRVAKPPPR